MTTVQEGVVLGAGSAGVADDPNLRGRLARVVPGLAAPAIGLGAALLGHRLVPAVGPLTWAVGLGILAGNLGLLPGAARLALGSLTKRLLRIGVVLLGFSVSFQSVKALGFSTVALVAVILVSTLVVTTWLGRRLRLSRARSLIIGTGFAICGASAIAAMEDTAGADEEDVAIGIAMVTLFGTVLMVLLPLLWHPLGLDGLQYGFWSGASIQEVGQVVAAAAPAGAAVAATAVVVKLTRVLMLAPVVATVSVGRRLRGGEAAPGTKRPPLVPLFVLGFIACVALRSTGLVPAHALSMISNVQVAALGAALFGMGAGVKIASLVKGGTSVLLVGALGTLFISVLSLAGILLLSR